MMTSRNALQFVAVASICMQKAWLYYCVLLLILLKLAYGKYLMYKPVSFRCQGERLPEINKPGLLFKTKDDFASDFGSRDFR